MARLVVMVPVRRRLCGRAALFAKDGRMLLGPFRVLATANGRIARAHGNPSREPRRPFGNTPSGSYSVAGSLPPGYRHPHRPRRFGTTGALMLAPQAGVAAEAAANGRRLLYLHAGPLDREGRLRPTYGGLRVSDRTLSALLAAINRAFASGDPLSSVEVIDVPEPSSKERGPQDQVGEGRPSPEDSGGGVGSAVRPAHALMLLGGAGLLRPKDGAPPEDPARRRLIAGALLLLGGIGVSACCDSDQPSPCQPVACDPVDSWCPPEGYVCPEDVYVDWYTGGGDDGDTSGGSG